MYAGRTLSQGRGERQFNILIIGHDCDCWTLPGPLTWSTRIMSLLKLLVHKYVAFKPHKLVSHSLIICISVSGVWGDIQKNNDSHGNSHGVISDIRDGKALEAR